MTAKIEIFDATKLNYAGFGPIGVYVNIGYEPLPEGYKTLPDSQFDSYEPDPGYLKNTGLRTPLFTGGFLSSPLLADGSYEYLVDSQGYSWLYNTFNYMAVSPFRRELYPAGITRYSAALYAPPPEGSIQIIVNDKNQSQTFAAKNENGSAIDYYFATDENGNKFILGSIDAAYAEDPSVPFGDAVFPSGWIKSVETLDVDLTIYPAYSDGNRRIYNQFRDNLTNNYFQISFAANGKGIAREVPGFALVGGNENDRIIGTSLSEELYGARGDDTLIGVEGNDRIWGDDGDDLLIPGKGSNSLWGGAGRDTFFIRQKGGNTVFDFSLDDGDIIRLGSSRYSLIDTADGVQITGQNLGTTLVLGIFANDLVAGKNFKDSLTGLNTEIAKATDDIYLYATADNISFYEEGDGVFYAPVAKRLSVLLPSASIDSGDTLYWYKVDDSNGNLGNVSPADPSYLKTLSNTNLIEILTTTLNKDIRAFSPDKAYWAYQKPELALQSEGVRIGELTNLDLADKFKELKLSSNQKFALAIKDKLGNFKATPMECYINPNINNAISFNSDDNGPEVVLTPGNGDLFIANAGLFNDTEKFDRITMNVDVTRVGSYISGYGLFKVDDLSGNFWTENSNFTEKPILPGSIAYAKEALRRSLNHLSSRLDGVTGLALPNYGSSIRHSVELATGNGYGIYITPNQILNSVDKLTDLSQILFSIKDANQGRLQQQVSMGTGYFAFEDMGIAGDRDFNDMLFTITPSNPSIIEA